MNKIYKIELDGIIGKEDNEYSDFLNQLKICNLKLVEEPHYSEICPNFVFTIQGSKQNIIKYLLNYYVIEEDELEDYLKSLEEA